MWENQSQSKVESLRDIENAAQNFLTGKNYLNHMQNHCWNKQ
jgi:hypothetical protein